MPRADVVVIGAGLAGLSAAARLAESGASVALVAKGHASTHWAAGGIDVAAPDSARTPADGVATLAAVPGHPYAVLGADVAPANTWHSHGFFVHCNINIAMQYGGIIFGLSEVAKDQRGLVRP